MKIHLDDRAANYKISSYQKGRIMVNGEILTRSFVLTPTTLVRDWPPQEFEALEAGHFETVASMETEVVLLGSGMHQRFPPAEVLRPLLDAGMAVEIMDTGAACRTFNILVSDGRKVAAALLMIGD